MGLFRKKTAGTATVSDSTVRIIRNNLENIGVTLPLSEKELRMVFDWAVSQKEACTANVCTIKFDGFTLEELELLVKELNPYGETTVDLTDINRRIKGSR